MVALTGSSEKPLLQPNTADLEIHAYQISVTHKIKLASLIWKGALAIGGFGSFVGDKNGGCSLVTYADTAKIMMLDPHPKVSNQLGSQEPSPPH